jgi:hypothetical protein
VAFFIRKLAEKNQRRGKKGGGGARTGGRGARVSRGSEVLKIRRGEGSRAWRARRWSCREKEVTHKACLVEDEDRGASLSCSANKEKVRCPVTQKGVDSGETATHFCSSFSKDQKEEE